MAEKTLSEFIYGYGKRGAVSFHTPGHKGRSEIFERYGFSDFATGIVAHDITEIPGADNLADPRGRIKELGERYADLYGAKKTYLSVNGSTACVMASILSTVPRGGKLVMGRNSHISAFNALRLGGIEPVYVESEIDENTYLDSETRMGKIAVALDENPDADAVFITSPNYFGALSDIYEIARIVREYGKILIVDQAHGAHLKFFDYAEKTKTAAENLGADIVIDSIHKSLLSFTGSSIVNVCSDDVDADLLAETLVRLQTTSPSYLLLESLDINEIILRKNGKSIIESWRSDLDFFYEEVTKIPDVRAVKGGKRDDAKITVSLASLGFSGSKLEKELRSGGIWAEFAHGEYVTLVTGAGNVRDDYVRLLHKLKEISQSYAISSKPVERRPLILFGGDLLRGDVPLQKEKIPLYKAEGRTLYGTITPYPPGIPVACPGEIIDTDLLRYIQKLIANDAFVAGIDEEGMVEVGRD